jgi:hypothetical protein
MIWTPPTPHTNLPLQAYTKSYAMQIAHMCDIKKNTSRSQEIVLKRRRAAFLFTHMSFLFQLRFLSQIHRVEAYLWFIFRRTKPDKRFAFTCDANKPFGLPLGLCFKELSNIHHAASPGRIMRCEWNELFDASKSVVGPLPLPDSQYVDPGKGDVVTQMQEIVEHRALAGSELHWQEMHDKWQMGPELTDDVLEHILVNSPCRISVLLSMTPSQIVNLNLSSQAIDAVHHDFEGCADMLRSLNAKEFTVLRTRAAAIWWLLLTAGAKIKKVTDKEFGEDQSLLLDAGIYVEPKAQHAESEQNDLLSRVLRVMIQLDMENTLTSQHTVRNYLLADDERSDAVSAILDDVNVKLGNAFINAIVARETLNAIMDGKIGGVIYSRLGILFLFLFLFFASCLIRSLIRKGLHLQGTCSNGSRTRRTQIRVK